MAIDYFTEAVRSYFWNNLGKTNYQSWRKKRNENMDVKQMHPEEPTVIPNGYTVTSTCILSAVRLEIFPSLYFNWKAKATCKNQM